ncbi:MAG TPA: hypothetical protein VE944_16290, partial [Nostoc sp.]|nr:hypothetical protein [Nostoc sp.]
MKSKNQAVFALIVKSTIVFLPLLLSPGIASGQSAPSPSPALTPALVLSNQEREELTRLRAEKRIQQQIQSDFNSAFSRTTILLNVWLVILSLFPVAIIALFWLLRRVVIREIVDRAMQQLQGMEKLQNQLATAKQEAENLIQEAKKINYELEQETVSLKQQIKNEQKKYLSNLTSELDLAKAQVL